MATRKPLEWMLVAGMSGDYSAFVHTPCGEEATVEVGSDPSVPNLNFKCEKCGKEDRTKIANARYFRNV